MAREFFSGEAGLGDLLPYDTLGADGVVIGKGEAAEHMASFMVQGRDLDFSTAGQLNAVAYRLNHMLKKFGSGWMVQVDAVRGKAIGYPNKGAFLDSVTAEIDARRRAAYEGEGSHFESRYVWTITYAPEKRVVRRIARALYNNQDARIAAVDLDDDVMTRFQTAMEDAEHELRSVYEIVQRLKRREVMDANTRDTVYVDDQLAWLAFAVTGENHPLRSWPETVLMPIRHALCSENFVGGNTPKLGKNWIAPLVITGFPAVSAPAMLGFLNSLALRYRWSTRFIFMESEEAKGVIKKKVKKWRQLEKGLKDQVVGSGRSILDQDAMSMGRDGEEALGLASGQDVRYGYLTTTIILMHEEQEMLNETANEVAKFIRDAGYQVRLDYGDTSDNGVEAWLGSLPGMSYANVRKPPVHTLNLAHLLPTTATWSGLPNCPHVRAYGPGAPPLMYALTNGNTPLRVTHHDQDVGHTVILGPTGTGKSTLLSLMCAQHRRYPGAAIMGMDKGYSLFALCNAAGGEYYELGGNSQINFAPLADVDDPKEASWACDWLEVLLKVQNVKVSPQHRSELDAVVHALGKQPRQHRTMSNLTGMVSDTEVYEALRQYTHAASHTILDGESDTLSSSRFQIYETSELLERGPEQIVPVMLYVFHRIERMLDGSPTVIPIDEGWTFLRGDYLEERLKKWLKEMRKLEGSVWFATQSIAEIVDSPIASVVIDSCPTKIYLANAQAEDQELSKFYARMGLNPVEIGRIARAQRYRDYYYKTNHGSRMMQLGLDDFALAYCGVAGPGVAEEIKGLKRTHGDQWTKVWEERKKVHRRFVA